MDFPTEQLEELKQLAPGASRADEGGAPFFLLPSLVLPEGCQPTSCECLLSPKPHSGYPSRLFFTREILEAPSAKSKPNWNAKNIQILGRNWFAYSWQTNQEGLRLVQLVMELLRGLR